MANQNLEKWVNKVHCMDCLEGMKQLPDGCVDLVVTDPPYGIEYQSNFRCNKFAKLQGDNNLNFVPEFIKEVNRLLKEETAFYCFVGERTIAKVYIEVIKYFKFKNLIAVPMIHQSGGDLWGSFAKNFELILYANKGRHIFNTTESFYISAASMKDKRYRGTGHIYRFSTLWDHLNSAPHNLSLIHPTEKNIKVFEFIINLSSNPGDLILDPFMGSGTTALACKQLGRRFIGFEINQKYVDIANERLKQEVLSL